jgi:tetratricopeptide (TPR) repeat protein
MTAALAALERLGHHDVLNPPEGEASSWSFWRSLGGRDLRRFGAIHHDALSALLSTMPRGGGARGLAVRGRLLRLLGEDAEAKRAFAASLAAAPNAAAAGWLGEMSIFADPRRALGLLARAAALEPSWAWPRLWRAAARLQLGEHAAAREELAAFARLHPSRVFVAGVLGFQAASLARDHREALREGEALIAADPLSPAGLEASARALLALGREAAALARMHEARDVDIDVTGNFFYNSEFALNWRKPDGFLARLDAAIGARPRLAALYAERAEFKRRPEICLYEEALADYAKAVALEPRRAWLRGVLGRAKNNLGGGGAGLEDFDRGVRLAPRCGWIRAWRGAVLARLGRKREALADFKAAERLMPWYSFTYAWRGALRNRMKDFAGARRDLEKAIRLDPSYTFSVYERFRALRGLKDYAGAVRDLNAAFAADPKYIWDGGDAELDAAVKARPDLGWLRAWRGRRRLAAGRTAEALADFDWALARERGDATLLAWRGRARHEAGRTREAIADLERAARLRPEMWGAHQALAEIHEVRGDKARALRSISEAARLAPTTAVFLLTKARLELELGRTAAGLATTERARQLAPELFTPARIVRMAA